MIEFNQDEHNVIMRARVTDVQLDGWRVNYIKLQDLERNEQIELKLKNGCFNGKAIEAADCTFDKLFQFTLTPNDKGYFKVCSLNTKLSEGVQKEIRGRSMTLIAGDQYVDLATVTIEINRNLLNFRDLDPKKTYSIDLEVIQNDDAEVNGLTGNLIC